MANRSIWSFKRICNAKYAQKIYSNDLIQFTTFYTGITPCANGIRWIILRPYRLPRQRKANGTEKCRNDLAIKREFETKFWHFHRRFVQSISIAARLLFWCSMLGCNNILILCLFFTIFCSLDFQSLAFVHQDSIIDDKNSPEYNVDQKVSCVVNELFFFLFFFLNEF